MIVAPLTTRKGSPMAPTFANGKICYLEMPALDIAESSAFYRDAFGWTLRTDDDGGVAFDDGVGQVSGMWTLGATPMRAAGIVVSIMVDDTAAACARVVARGGSIVTPADPDADEQIARFRDPAGNLMSIYQHRG
jgi:predicted enzyme related to lactoylglutathione lyase